MEFVGWKTYSFKFQYDNTLRTKKQTKAKEEPNLNSNMIIL